MKTHFLFPFFSFKIKKIIYLSFLFFLLFSNFSYTQWELRNNGISGAITGWAIDAIDSNVAVAAFQKKIFKTENAGLNWVNITPANYSDFYDISMVDKSRIWVVTQYEILSTTNGGKYWGVQFNNNPRQTNFMNYIEMFDVNNGIAMGDATSTDTSKALFIKTNDGFNWISVNNDFFIQGASNNIWRQLDFIDMNNGYFGALSSTISSEVYKTTDGGQTWIQTHQGLSPQILKFYNKYIGIVITYAFGGGALRTVDGLNTVDTISNLTTFNPSDIEFFPGDPSRVFYLTYDRLFFSSDTGKTWQVVFEPSGGLWGEDIVLTNDNHGWIISDAGNIYYNANIDIITDVGNGENTIPNKFILSQNYPNPFNPMTTISYSIPKGSFVTLIIYDILGREVKILVNKFQTAGDYKVNFNAKGFASGVYIYRISAKGGAANFVTSKKLVLMK